MWCIPLPHEVEATDSDTDPWVRLVREFQGHPFYSSDDLVMATWFAREAIGASRPLLFDNSIHILGPPGGPEDIFEESHYPGNSNSRPADSWRPRPRKRGRASLRF